MQKFFLTCLFLGGLCFTTAYAYAAPLNLCFEDVPQTPWTMPNNTGLNISLLKMVEKALGEHFIYSSKPWKRCQEETRSGVSDGFFGASVSEERQQYSVFPHFPNGSLDTSAYLNEDKFNVFLRKGGAGSWDGKKLQSPHMPVVAQRGYLVASVLRDNGLTVVESVKSAEEGLLSLQHSADVAVLQGVEASHLAKHDPRFKDSVILSPVPYLTLPLFLAINRQLYEQNPHRIDAIWAAIHQIRESDDYRTLLDNAGLK